MKAHINLVQPFSLCLPCQIYLEVGGESLIGVADGHSRSGVSIVILRLHFIQYIDNHFHLVCTKVGKFKALEELINLHDKNDKVVFNSIIVITDRLVLDKQLQDTIYQFQHVEGVVTKIDNNAAQLADALNTGKKIIITTLQKFPFVLEKVDDLSGKRFAVIVDEAHSSQTGEASKKMKAILGNAEGLTEEEQLQKVADEEA